MNANETDLPTPAELAPGVYGLTEEMHGILVIHALYSDPPGQGHCARYLDSLPTDRPILVVRVISEILQAMLCRRGFTPGKISVEGIGETDVYVRGFKPAGR